MGTTSQQIIYHAERLGAHLRKLRQSQKKTVAELASQVGLSKGYISLVESGKRSPHWSTLLRIVQALDETLCRFLTWGNGIENTGIKIRSDQQDLIVVTGSEPDEWNVVANADSEGYTWILTPYQEQMQSTLVRFRLPAHSAWTPSTIISPAYITAYGLEGSVLLEYGNSDRDEFTLSEGETLQFEGSHPHRFRNYSDESSEVLLMITPARF